MEDNGVAGNLTAEQINKLAKLRKKDNFSLRELFEAFDVDGDGVITKKDLKKLAESDGKGKTFSRKDINNLYAKLGYDICQIMQNRSEDEFINIDDLYKALDQNKDGKVLLGDFLRIAKKDGNFMFITSTELEQELQDKWKQK